MSMLQCCDSPGDEYHQSNTVCWQEYLGSICFGTCDENRENRFVIVEVPLCSLTNSLSRWMILRGRGKPWVSHGTDTSLRIEKKTPIRNFLENRTFHPSSTRLAESDVIWEHPRSKVDHVTTKNTFHFFLTYFFVKQSKK